MYDDLLHIEPTGLKPEAGRLLVSTPYFNDPFFNHSVVLITDYETEHTAGLIINRQLPHTEAGDVLVIHDAGAHGHSMGYNYNGRLRCAEYMLHTDGELSLIRRAETAADYFATLDIDEEFWSNELN